MGDWSQLIPELLIMIARRIKMVEDFMAFRGVCTSWRAVGIEANFVNSHSTIPLLMLDDEEKENDDRQFYSLYRGKIWRTLSLPEVKDKEYFESRGWLLLTSEMSGELSLFHPFSRAQIELPHFEGIYTYPHYHKIKKAVLSANPSDTTKFVLVMIYGCTGMLEFWTPGDNSWGRIETSYIHDDYAISDAYFYDGKLYAISYEGNIWVWDTSRRDPAVAQHLFCINSELLRPEVALSGINTVLIGLYIVESSSSLLIFAQGISFIRDDHETRSATDIRVIQPYFRVIQPDFIEGRWEEITSLEEKAIFVGHNGAVCVDTTSFPGVIKPNCVYFFDDGIDTYNQPQGGSGKNTIGVYNFEDRKIERFVDVQPFSSIYQPIWVTPSLM